MWHGEKGCPKEAGRPEGNAPPERMVFLAGLLKINYLSTDRCVCVCVCVCVCTHDTQSNPLQVLTVTFYWNGRQPFRFTLNIT